MIKVLGVVTVVSAMIPTNLFVYATSDTSYVQKVSSTINIDSMKELNVNKDEEDEINENVVTDIAEVLGMEVKETNTYSLVFGEELAEFGVIYKYKEDKNVAENFNELTELTSAELSNYNVVEVKDQKVQEELLAIAAEKERQEQEAEAKRLEEERIKAEEEAARVAEEERIKAEEEAEKNKFKQVDQSEVLLEIAEPDPEYTGTIVTLAPEDRDLLERLVMGEAGGEGMAGAALVAQAIRDTMVYKGFNSVAEVRIQLAYQGHIDTAPNQNVKDACAFIFDQGGCAVKHRIFYFYAPARVSSAFHETQHFIIEHGGHKFFSNW